MVLNSCKVWFLVSTHNLNLDGLIENIREHFSSPRKFPIIVNRGRYANFPPLPEDSQRKNITPQIDWPCPAPVEFLKRTPYFIGKPGDIAVIIDTDERIVECPKDYLFEIQKPGARVRLIKENDSFQAYIPRIFRIQEGMHHWGAHEVVAKKDKIIPRSNLPKIDQIVFRHLERDNEEYLEKKQKGYYQELSATEQKFRRYCRWR